MEARIFKPAKTAMQSGKSKTNDWVLEFIRDSARRVEPLMGYTASSDMRAQIKLSFDTKEDAIAYAEREGIAFRVIEPKVAKAGKAKRPSYADNFAYGRPQPWTH